MHIRSNRDIYVPVRVAQKLRRCFLYIERLGLARVRDRTNAKRVIIGAFATASRLFDIYAMLAIGVGAFFLRRRGYEMAPLVLGLVLGHLLDKSLRRGLVLSDGSIAPFFTRPISLAFAVVTIFTILMYVPAFRQAVKRVTAGVGAAIRNALGRKA